MARIRTIKPEFPQSESMGRVSRDARLCFIMLWTIADDGGRLRGNSRMLASLLFPYDDDAKKLIDKWLIELQREGCVVRYEVCGDAYLEICHWNTHQKIDKPSRSKLPAKPMDKPTREDSREFGEGSQDAREVSSEDQGPRTEGPEDQGPPSCAEPLCDSPPPLVLIPLVGGSEHPVMASDVSDWSDAYPAIDVLQQVKAMRAWAIANPKNQKTAAGVRRFITAWLAKAQDKAPPPGRHGFKRVEAEPAWRTEQRDRMAQVVGPHAARRTETTLELIDGNTAIKLG